MSEESAAGEIGSDVGEEGGIYFATAHVEVLIMSVNVVVGEIDRVCPAGRRLVALLCTANRHHSSYCSI